MGANSISATIVDTAGTQLRLLVASGGDDQALCCNLTTLQVCKLLLLLDIFYQHMRLQSIIGFLVMSIRWVTQQR